MYRTLKKSLALLVGALTSLERLIHYQRGKTRQSAVDHLLNLVLLLHGTSSKSALTNLEIMSWLCLDVAQSLLNKSKSQIMVHLSSHSLGPPAIKPELVSNLAFEDRKIRLQSSCGHIDALLATLTGSKRSGVKSQEHEP